MFCISSFALSLCAVSNLVHIVKHKSHHDTPCSNLSSNCSESLRIKSNFIFLKDFIYLFLERREGREKERERNIYVQEMHQLVASCTPPTGELV